jgi:formate hydrogenlyase transcriptional activator
MAKISDTFGGRNDRIKNVLILAASFKILFLPTRKIGLCLTNKLQRRSSEIHGGNPKDVEKEKAGIHRPRRHFQGSGSRELSKQQGYGREVHMAALAMVRCAQRADENTRFQQIVGNSPALVSVLEQVQLVGPTDSTVLILGETGTGKELIARAIHNASPRCGHPFVTLNCAAIPAELLESELFGHERGAFTGAVTQRIGRFEAANGGTLFLDEIGDMPLALQAKLLRVLQEQEFERLGSTATRRADVRIVAATNQDLVALIADKQFRMDLYYRLNVFPIALPPLRERVSDIPLLVKHFVETYGARMSKRISRISNDSMEALKRYPWPGNIRELQNFIERTVILTSGDVLELPPLQSLIPTKQAPVTFRESERHHLLKALEATNWVVGGPSGAAARLGMPRTTLIAKMQKHAISREMAQSVTR